MSFEQEAYLHLWQDVSICSEYYVECGVSRQQSAKEENMVANKQTNKNG